MTARNPHHALRAGFFPAAQKLGYPIVLLTDHPDRYDEPGIEVVGCDVLDHQNIINSVQSLPRPAAIFSNSDHLQEATALAAQHFGLPGKDPAAARRVKNKFEMRRRLAEAGVDVVRSHEIFPGTRVDSLPSDFFPAVLKPREGIASEDVRLVKSMTDLRTELTRVRRSRPDAVFVLEEFLPGRLFTLETMGDGKDLHVFGGFATTIAPGKGFIEQRRDFPHGLPAEITDQVLEWLGVLDVNFGSCHTEFVVGHDDKPRPIEVNYRMVGGDDEYVLSEATGQPIFEMVLKLHLGVPLQQVLAEAPPDRKYSGSVESVLAKRSGKLMSAPPASRNERDGITVTCRPIAEVGQTVIVNDSNRDYLANVRVIGPDPKTVDGELQTFLNDNRWQVEGQSLDDAETQLVMRVVDALVREDIGGITRFVNSGMLAIPGLDPIHLVPSDFQQSQVVGSKQLFPLPSLDELVTALTPVLGANLHEGLARFHEECDNALDNARLYRAMHKRTLDRVGGDRTNRLGATGATYFDTLASFVPHPVYPTATARPGFDAGDTVRYGPESHPTFRLQWLAVPPELVAQHGELPEWWPSTADVGLRPEHRHYNLIPVHPTTFRHGRLPHFLREAGLYGQAVVAGRQPVVVQPTLSARTLAVFGTDDQIKVPLAIKSLGANYGRSIRPGTLHNGAATQQILDAIVKREGLGKQVVIADESTFGTAANHRMFSYLVRRSNGTLDGRYVAPAASLLAPTPDGRLVAQFLADESVNGDVPELFDRYLDQLFGFNVKLFARYGVALEGHQQNTALLVEPGNADSLLFVKDHDSPRVVRSAVERAFGAAALAGLNDGDIFADDRAGLVPRFTTITLHLSAMAVARGLHEHGLLDRFPAEIVSERLYAALEPYGAEVDPLRDLFDSPFLACKNMIGPGTFNTKEENAAAGITDVGQSYRPGPNYLQRPELGLV